MLRFVPGEAVSEQDDSVEEKLVPVEKKERERGGGGEHSRMRDKKRAARYRGWIDHESVKGRDDEDVPAWRRETALFPRCSPRLTELEVNLSLDSGSILQRAGGGAVGGGRAHRRLRRAFHRAEAILCNFWLTHLVRGAVRTFRG